MAYNVTLMNASYQNVPAVVLPKTGGGTARFVADNDIGAKVSGGQSVFKNYATQAADTWEYIGLSVTVPANHIYIGNITTDWQMGKPLGLGIGTSNTGTPAIRFQPNDGGSIMTSPAVYLTPGTYYLFAMRGAASSTQNTYQFFYTDIDNS